MDATALRSLVDSFIVEYDRASQDGNEACRRALVSKLQSALSKNPLDYRNFFRCLTYDSGAEALQYRILQGHLLSDSCALDNGQHEAIPKPRRFRKIFKNKKTNKLIYDSLFSALPHHIVQIILEDHVDLATLTSLRRVNRSTRAAVNECSKYALILHHAPHILRAALSVKAASAFTCHDLWTAFVTKECTNCGEFGGFLYLPTCSRACFWCGMKSERYRPLPLKDVKQYYSITKYELALHGAAIIDPLPGHYYNTISDEMDTEPVVDMMVASRVASQVYDVEGDPDMVNIMIQILRQDHYDRGLCSLPHHSDEVKRRLIHKPELEFIKLAADLQWSCPHRLKCLIAFPWLDISNENGPSVTMGVSCAGCGHRRVVLRLPHLQPGPSPDFLSISRRVDHSNHDFVAHFLNCRQAIKWWRLNPHGLPPAPSPLPIPRLMQFAMLPHEHPEKTFSLWDIISRAFKLKKPHFLASMRNKQKTESRLSFHQPNFTS